MKNLTVFALAFLACFAVAQDSAGVDQSTSGAVVKGKVPVSKSLLKVKLPKPTKFQLKNGLTVFVMEDHRSPAVRLNLSMKGGTMFEPKPGVAAMTANMLSEGAAKHTNDQITEWSEGLGYSLGASAALDTVSVSAAALTDSLDPLFDLFGDVVLHPTFPQDRLDKAKSGNGAGGFGGGQGGPGRRGGGANPAAALTDIQNKLFFGGTPLERKVTSREDRNKLTRDDLVAYHTDFFRPNGAILTVVGDIKPAEAKKRVEALFGSWTPGQKEMKMPEFKYRQVSEPHIYLVDRPNAAQTILQFGVMGVAMNDEDAIALTVANRILGGGSSGRLFQNIRERKGFTYGAYSTFTPGRFRSVWGANANVRTEVTEPAVAEFFVEFKRLQTSPVTLDELGRAKRSILGSWARTVESPDAVLSRTIDVVTNGLSGDYWDKYAAKIDAVTPADIMRVAQKYMGGNRMQMFVVGERAKIESGLAKYGPVTVVDPAKVGELFK
jgi:predicted Zn-dependent peptidase